jgi:hypothetical protein
MKVSRREFVSTASCAAAASLCALPSSAFAAPDNAGEKSRACGALLDLESNCVLPESLGGMRAALGSSHRCIAASDLVSSDVDGALIVAAAGSTKPETFSAVAELLARGAMVLWESGAAYLSAGDFVQQQALTKEHFGVSIGEPVEIWPLARSRESRTGATIEGARANRAIGHEQIPYISYRWPQEAHVRDFSRVLPVSGAKGQAIAYWGNMPVAISKNVGEGALVFLGSPLGPALLAGDLEAHQLFRSIVA